MSDKFKVTEQEIENSLKIVKKSFNALDFKALMEKFEIQVNHLKDEAKKIRVGGPDTELKSIEMSTIVKKLNKTIDSVRMKAKRPHLDFNQSLDGMVRPVQQVLTSIEAGERKKCTTYRNDLLKKEEAAKALKEKKIPEKKFAGLSLRKTKPIRPAEGSVQTSTAGSGSYKKEPVAKLVDIKKVPAEYLEVNWAAVKAALKNGVTKIDGFDIVEEMKMTIRS